MNRAFPSIAAFLLMSAGLGACSSISPDKPAAAAPDKHAQAPASFKSMAADLDAQIQSAHALRGQGDYEGAVRALSQLMLVAPDNARVISEYGKALVQQGRPKEALDFLKRAAQLAPQDWTLYSAAGFAYDQDGQYASAKIAYQQALALKPGEPSVLNNFALSRMQAGDVAGARDLFRAAGASGAVDPKIASNLALFARISPAEQVAPVAARPHKDASVAAVAMPSVPRPSPSLAEAKSAAPHAMMPKPVETVMMEQIPVDPKAGPVKSATAAPRKLAGQTVAPPAAATRKAVASGKQIARSAKKVPAAKAHVAAAKPSVPKPAGSVPDKTKKGVPALRMTADAATP